MSSSSGLSSPQQSHFILYYTDFFLKNNWRIWESSVKKGMDRNHLSSDEKEFLIKLNGNSYEFSCIFLPKTLASLAKKGYVTIEERGSRVYSTLRSFEAILTDAGQARVDNFELEKKMELVRAAIEDWGKGELSDAAAMYAISLVVLPQPEMTEERKRKVLRLIKERGWE
jgi:hypothetical protein